MVPNAVFLVIVIVLPLLLAIYISLRKIDQYTLANWFRAPWVGLDNYVTALTGGNVLSVSMLESAGISIAFALITTLVTTPIGVLAAITVNATFRGRAIMRSLYLLPYIIPGVVVALIWRIMMFRTGDGLIDQILGALHAPWGDTAWLIGPHSFWALTIAEIWHVWPFMYLIVLAGLQGIGKEQYESAEIDGAGSWQKLTRVVLPQMRSIIGIALLLSTFYHFNSFTLAFVMFGISPPPGATLLPLNVYVSSFGLFRFGLGGAMSVITLIIMLIPGIIYVRSVRLDETVA